MKAKSKTPTIPKSPLELAPHEAAMYKTICRHLAESKAFQKIDAYFVAITARSWARCQRFEEQLDQEGAVQVFDNGSTNVSGYYTALQRERDFFKQACQILGMNAAGREKILAFKADANETGGIMRKLQVIREKSRKVV